MWNKANLKNNNNYTVLIAKNLSDYVININNSLFERKKKHKC